MVRVGTNLSLTLYFFIFPKGSDAKQATLVVFCLHEEAIDFQIC
jgi:hypothetical protein